MDCLFCKIANHEKKTDVVYENEEFIVINDIHPQAPIHLLIIPKKHIETINHLEEVDKEMAARILFLAKDLAGKKGIAEQGYRLTFNVGRGGGQIIDHVHLHLMGGWRTPCGK